MWECVSTKDLWVGWSRSAEGLGGWGEWAGVTICAVCRERVERRRGGARCGIGADVADVADVAERCQCGSAGVRLRGMVSRRRRGRAAGEGSGAELATFLLGGNAAEGKVGWHWWCGDRGGDARLRWVAWQRRWRVDRGVHLRPKEETGRVCGLPAGAEACGCAGVLVGGGGGGGPVGVAARDRSGVLVGGGPVGVAARDCSGVLGGAGGVSSESATCGCSGGCGAERWCVEWSGGSRLEWDCRAESVTCRPKFAPRAGSEAAGAAPLLAV
jgi:hypothetical protein